MSSLGRRGADLFGIIALKVWARPWKSPRVAAASSCIAGRAAAVVVSTLTLSSTALRQCRDLEAVQEARPSGQRRVLRQVETEGIAEVTLRQGQGKPLPHFVTLTSTGAKLRQANCHRYMGIPINTRNRAEGGTQQVRSYLAVRRSSGPRAADSAAMQPPATEAFADAAGGIFCFFLSGRLTFHFCAFPGKSSARACTM